MKQRFRYFGLSVLLLAGTVLVGGTGGGCGVTGDSEEYTNYTCDNPIPGRKDDFGHPDPCCHYKPCCPNPNIDHYFYYEGSDLSTWDPCCLESDCGGWNVWAPQNDPADAGDASSDAQSSFCPGQCVPTPDEGWFWPVLLWQGPSDQEPLQCPAGAPHEGYHGHADLFAPPKSCSICTCDSPQGECGLPSHLAVSANTCALPGGILTPFDAPASWDGSCTSQDAIAAGAQCGGSLCVTSLPVDPLTLTESCAPHAITPKDGPNSEPDWKTAALGCIASDYPPCSPTQICAPPPEPGFSTCVFTWGDDHQCPEFYPNKRILYENYKDTRLCTDCTCEPPVGSLCTAQLSLYKDSACVNLLASKPIASTGSGCVDFQPPGPPLGSKAITNLTYTPGSCQPGGGDLAGELTKVGVATFCCLQS